MITELRGCSLARQYPCLGQHSLSYHIISLNPRMCREIRSEDTKTSSAVILPFSLVLLLFPSFLHSRQRGNNYPWCFRWPGGCAEAHWLWHSPVLVRWNKHQLTTHQSLWDSPILFRGEWIILPNPNTLSAPWLPWPGMLGHTLHTAQITSTEVTIPGQGIRYRNWDLSQGIFSHASNYANGSESKAHNSSSSVCGGTAGWPAYDPQDFVWFSPLSSSCFLINLKAASSCSCWVLTLADNFLKLLKIHQRHQERISG